jgi:hypothetical protein
VKKLNQHALNQAIEAFIAQKDANREAYTPQDLSYIQQYEGSGGQGSRGATGEGLLYEFYTPEYLVGLLWQMAYHYGYTDGGTVLEPSVATGRLLQPAKDYSKCVGFEINPVSARIAGLTCPGATIHTGYFETAFLQAPRFTSRIKRGLTWLPQYPFSLVIGNPPYGIYQNQYKSYFPEAKKLKQIEIFFMYQGLQLLRPEGLLVYLTSSNFLRNGEQYNVAKAELARMATIVDAYRLPPVFQASQVPCDILVFRRK